jgi:hypothetical protein
MTPDGESGEPAYMPYQIEQSRVRKPLASSGNTLCMINEQLSCFAALNHS